MLDDRERKELLDAEIQKWAKKGWRVENRSDHQATIAKGKKVSHLLHLVLSLITLGVWLIIWLLMGLFGGIGRRLVTVDPDGNVKVTKI